MEKTRDRPGPSRPVSEANGSSPGGAWSFVVPRERGSDVASMGIRAPPPCLDHFMESGQPTPSITTKYRPGPSPLIQATNAAGAFRAKPASDRCSDTRNSRGSKGRGVEPGEAAERASREI